MIKWIAGVKAPSTLLSRIAGPARALNIEFKQAHIVAPPKA